MRVLRSVTPYEYITLGHKNWTQLAIDLVDTKHISKIFEMLNREVIGLHLHLEDGKLIYDKKDPIIIKEPKLTSNISLEQSAKFCFDNSPKDSEKLGAIYYNQNRIVLNVSHICADGRFLTKQLNHILNISEYKFQSPKTILTPFEVCFSNQLKQMKPSNYNVQHDPHITRIIMKNYNRPHDPFFKYESFTFPAKELILFNQNKLKGFNEELHTSFILTALAFSPKSENPFKNFGTCSCVDLRHRVERNLDTVCNAYGQIGVKANVNEAMTISQVNQLMKQSFKDAIGGDAAFALHNVAKHRMTNTEDKMFAPLPGRRLDMSNVGPLRIHPPVSDVWISAGQKNDSLGSSSFYSISYSIINEIQNRNDMVFIFRHDNKDLSNDDVYKFANGMKYFLTEIPISMTLGEAYKELRNFFS